MKRVIVSLVLASVLLVPQIAQSHGSCVINRGAGRTGAVVQFSAVFVCQSNGHYYTRATVWGERRTPGQVWNTVAGPVTATNSSNTAYNSGVASTTIGFDCKKDYRARGWGTAQPGNHDQALWSSVLYHSC